MTTSRRLGRLIAATTTASLTLALTPAAFAQETVEFSVSNITDFHGYLEYEDYNGYLGAALLAGLNNQINGDENVFTTSGDNVGGSNFVSAISNDTYTLQALNAAGVDVSAVGNHEFDQGQDDLLGRIAPASDYPILGANVYRNGERILPAHDIQERNGVRIAFVGTVTPQTAAKVAPSAIEGIEFRDPVAETNQVARELIDGDRADVVIALMHDDAASLAAGFDTDYVDAVFGGDSHIVYQAENPIVALQSGEYGKVLTDVDFTFDPATGEVTVAEITQYDLAAAEATGATPDATVAGIVAEAQTQADVLGAEQVATLANSFSRGNDYGLDQNGNPTTGNNRGSESTLNHLIAEAGRASMADFLGEDVDLGFMNAGGVRQDLPAGEVTYRDVFNIQPFGNGIAVGNLTGADILLALEQQWKDPAGSRPRLALGFSDGFTYSYDPTAPQGERVIEATLHGEPIDPARTYSVAMSSFLFDGGDGFDAFTNVTDYRDVGYKDVTALADYLEANPAVEPRGAQGDVGVTIDGTLAAGETITLDLTSLNYSTESEPQATTATVTLGTATGTANIDTRFTPEFDRYNEHGTATIELTIPEGLTGTQNIVITTDTGTEVTVPVVLDGSETGADDDGSSDGSSVGSSAFGIVAILAAVAGILGGVQFFAPELFAGVSTQIQAQIDALLTP